MTGVSQKRLAIALAIVAAAIFAGANVHMLVVALNSQPPCAIVAGVTPARQAC